MVAMNISRLSLSYDAPEDRLRMAVGDAGGRTLGLCLTRRLTMGVVAMMRDCLEGNSEVAGRTLPVVQQDKTIPVQGLYQVDEAALEALDDAAYLLLRSKKALPLAHAQLLSMNLMPWLWQMTQARADSARAKPRLPSGTSPELGLFALLEDDGVLKFG